MKQVCITLVVIIFLIVFAVGVQRMGVGFTAKRARTLRVGDSKNKVEQVLGRPVRIFVPQGDILAQTLFGVTEETWAYGKQLDFRKPFHAEFPYVSPDRLIRLRFGSPDADDIAIAFDSTGRISNITTP